MSDNRFLRVPSWCRSQLVADRFTAAIRILPQDLDSADPQELYAVRLKDAFQDEKALWNSERGFVRQAIRRFLKASVISCSDKDPLLVLSGLTQVAVSDQEAIKRIQFFRPPQEFTIEVDLQEQQEQSEWAVQELTGTPTEMTAIPLKFKNYKVIRSDAVHQSNNKCLFFPRHAILNQSNVCMSITVAQGHDAQGVIPQLLEAGFSQIHVCSKAHVRIALPAGGNKQEAAERILKMQGISSIVDEETGHKKFSLTKVQVKDTKKVMIRRQDGMPIDPRVWGTILLALKLQRGRLVGQVGYAEAENAKDLHERDINGKYTITWLAADASQSA